MKRHLQFLAVFAILGMLAGTAGAQTLDQAKVAGITKAADGFVALAKDSRTSGKPPRQTDAAAKPLLDTVFDTKAIEGGKPLPWSDLKLLEQWNVALTKVGLVYYLAGTGAADLQAASKDPATIAKATQNIVAFAPEYGRYLDAQLRVHSALIDVALTQIATATPEQAKEQEFRRTLHRISGATAEALTGAIDGMALEGMTDAWLLGRVVTMLDITPRAAKFMAPDDRERVQTAAVAVAQRVKNTDVQSGLNAVARGFEMLAR
jgi:hypothetical protein